MSATSNFTKSNESAHRILDSLLPIKFTKPSPYEKDDVYKYQNHIYIILDILYLPKTKKFGCVGRGDLTSLFFSKVAK